MSDQMDEPFILKGGSEEFSNDVSITVETSDRTDDGEAGKNSAENFEEVFVDNSLKTVGEKDKRQNGTGQNEAIRLDGISSSEEHPDVEPSTYGLSSAEFLQPVPEDVEQTATYRESAVDIGSRSAVISPQEPNQSTTAALDIALLDVRWGILMGLIALIPNSVRRTLRDIERAKDQYNLGAFVLYVVKPFFRAVDNSTAVDVIWGCISVFMMYLGMEQLFHCQAYRLIPVFMFDGGIFGLMSSIGNAVLRSTRIESGRESSYCGTMTIRFTRLTLYFWYILGACWVYSTYPPNYEDTSNASFCDPFLYKFSFAFVTIVMILSFSFLLLIFAAIAYYKLSSPGTQSDHSVAVPRNQS